MFKMIGIAGLWQYTIRSLLLVCCLQGAAFPDESKNAKKPVIPYPKCSMHLERGLLISISFGVKKPKNNFFSNKNLHRMDHNLFQWRGEGSFYYTPWLSGGASAQILAGEPSGISTEVENRYTVFARLHRRFGAMSLFAGPFFGLYNLEFSVDSSEALPEPAENKGVDIHNTHEALVDYGLSVGWGWKTFPSVGLSAAGSIEHVVSSELLFQYGAGINLDIMQYWPGMKGLTQGFFLGLEWQFERIFDWEYPRRKKSHSISFSTGVGF
jgi:hypothetical protein